MGKRGATRILFASAAALTCAACASAFPIPSGSQTATVTFVATPSRDNNLAQLNFTRMSGPTLQAQDYREEHFLTLIIQPDAIPTMFVPNSVKLSEDVVFQAGVPLFVRVSGSIRPDESRLSGYDTYCANGVSFTPASGGRYRFTQIVDGDRCTVEVTNSTDQSPPPDLRFFDPDAGRTPDFVYGGGPVVVLPAPGS